MKISKSLAEKLLIESASFRSHVLNSFYNLTEETEFRQKIELHVMNAPTKINAIKRVREIGTGDTTLFKKAYPESNGVYRSENGQEYVGLVASKMIVEEIMKKKNIDF